MTEELRRTALHAWHVAHGGRMVPFGGWSMPVQYPSGILAEHRAVRAGAGLFDISHMGRVEVVGPDAGELLQRTTTNDVAALAPMRAQYSLLCNAEGGVLDDLIVYRLAPPSPPNDGGEGGGPYLVVVNAANRERDVAWWRSQAQALRLDVELVDRTFELAMIALQGPAAEALLQPLAEAPLENMRYYSALRTRVTSREVLLARTGYTGEDGFELMVASDQATDLWEELRAQAIPSPPVDWGTEGGGRGQPSAAGLGARDTLRLEAGMALYGHELTEETTPLEAGLGRVVKLEKGPFVGAEALAAQRAAGLRRQLVGFEMVDSAIPRQGYTVTTAPPAVGEPSTGEPIGVVTSGTFGPSVQRQIGMAYVPPELAAEGAELGVVVRERTARARVRPLPFWKHRTKRIRT